MVKSSCPVITTCYCCVVNYYLPSVFFSLCSLEGLLMGQEMAPSFRGFVQLRKLRPGQGSLRPRALQQLEAELRPQFRLSDSLVSPSPVPLRGALRSSVSCGRFEPRAGLPPYPIHRARTFFPIK